MEEQETGYTASCGLETDRFANESTAKAAPTEMDDHNSLVRRTL